MWRDNVTVKRHYLRHYAASYCRCWLYIADAVVKSPFYVGTFKQFFVISQKFSALSARPSVIESIQGGV